ncbi:nudix domain protein [Colletotrichum truncatum]|uniref:Nudix domain protein n=1 Tax=Colletotrichum truncatum TaxID=5467 RepID=A0ACC3YI97_COLTU|nr:nudix domain protein [Colletotrichum truncatum]KAF6792967.1 nudix domain protein [Colletotrichum truncatum]
MATAPNSQAQPPPPPPAFTLTFPPSLESYNRTARAWLTENSKHWDGIVTGALVFDSQNRVLLLQRAAHDSMPNLWETPGGATDDEDASLFVACARELWEEAGLEAVEIVRAVTEGPDRPAGSVFTNRNGTRIYSRFSFEVKVKNENEVRIDPAEHQDYVWATEEEVKAQRVGDKPIPITIGQMTRIILEGFRLRREEAVEGGREVVQGR